MSTKHMKLITFPLLSFYPNKSKQSVGLQNWLIFFIKKKKLEQNWLSFFNNRPNAICFSS